MNINNWKQAIPSNFPDESTIWIYQSNQFINDEQQIKIQQAVDAFTGSWLSHKQPVKGWGSILFNQFIILMADETKTQVSGCSKDSMMHFIQSLEKEYSLSLLDRTQLAFFKKDQVEIISLKTLPQKISSGEIDEQTIYFNNTISNKQQLLNEWIVEVQHSWLTQKISYQSKTSIN